MNLIKPKKLKNGDTIAVIAPAGEVDTEKIENAISYFEKKGYKIIRGKNLNKKHNYLAGSDDERLEDLHNAFSNTSIDAIFCARGGYGSLRLINKINYEIIKKNPKIFCGYSDITALSAMIFKNCNLITFSAPMLQGDFSQNIIPYTEECLKKTITSNNISIKPANSKIYNEGNAQGILLAGNLTTFSSLAGIEFLPNEDFIFMTEDIGEKVYQIDRHFQQLLNLKDFKQNLKGILLGEFTKTDNPKWLEDFFKELAKELSIPIIGGYELTHANKKITIPYGAQVKLNNEIITINNYLS